MTLIVLIVLCFEKFHVTFVYIIAIREYFCMNLFTRIVKQEHLHFIVKFMLKYENIENDKIMLLQPRWWPSVVVSSLASINEVNRRGARLVLRWVTVSAGSILADGAEHLSRYVTGHPGQLSLANCSWVVGAKPAKGR